MEELVNEAIEAAYPVVCREMTVAEAKAEGAIGLFESQVRRSASRFTPSGDVSKEICGGPHAGNTAELVSFKIQEGRKPPPPACAASRPSIGAKADD